MKANEVGYFEDIADFTLVRVPVSDLLHCIELDYSGEVGRIKLVSFIEDYKVGKQLVESFCLARRTINYWQ